jgi:two-component system phosphate regulon sensor histidine kinase PhoR
VHRVTALYMLTPILGTGGLACLGLVIGDSGRPGAGPWPWVGVGLLIAAAGSALAAAVVARRSCAWLSEQLESVNKAIAEANNAANNGIGANSGIASANSGIAAEGGISNANNAAAGSAIADANKVATEAALIAKELEIQLKKVNDERQRAEAIVYNISDAVMVTDALDELVLANEAAATMFQFHLDASHRRPINEILHDSKFVSLIRETRQGDGGGGRRVVEQRVDTPAGERAFRITLSTLPGEAAEANAAGVVAVLHDITHEKEVSEMKNDFVSNVSHELRTPLASIKAYVELLIDGEANDEKTKREFYEVIQNEANRLGRLIDNILNISRIESGLIKADKKPQSLTAVIRDALEVIAPQAAQKNIRVVERLMPVRYQTTADRDMLYQAVLNVLGNAVKYTRGGGEIRVETTVDEARRKLVTRVIDTGVGIPAKDLPYVFDKFYRAEANNRVAAGTGLGLSLVKHIIEVVHHGRMFVESEVGKGSTFAFELDLYESGVASAA